MQGRNAGQDHLPSTWICEETVFAGHHGLGQDCRPHAAFPSGAGIQRAIALPPMRSFPRLRVRLLYDLKSLTAIMFRQ
jgi:hypothetical protein